MRKYVIEREIPGIGNSSAADLQGIAKRSNAVLAEMGKDIQWVHSYVTGNKIYCVYLAASEDIVRQHANRGGFPANSIAEVKNIFDPTTAGD